MPPAEDDEDYNSASDSDFNDAELSGSSAAEDESDAAETKTKGRKGKSSKKDVDGDVEMASGDEGIVAQAQKKKKKKKPKGKSKSKGAKGDEEQDVDEEDEEDDAPVGVRVRLRSGRGGQEVQEAVPTTTVAATADIDAIWARMNNPSAFNQTTRPLSPPPEEKEAEPSPNAPPPAEEPPTPHPSTTEPTITIPHTYTFAGETHTSTKTVPISSPAARAYLASVDKTTLEATAAAQSPPKSTGPTLRRPLARKGLLEPNPSGLLNSRGTTFLPRADLPPAIGGSRAAGGNLLAEKVGVDKGKENRNKLAGEKLNTVEKSKLDWEAEVERAGMREELEKAEKSGGSYLGRVEFLKRVEGGEEERARIARAKARGLA